MKNKSRREGCGLRGERERELKRQLERGGGREGAREREREMKRERERERERDRDSDPIEEIRWLHKRLRERRGSGV